MARYRQVTSGSAHAIVNAATCAWTVEDAPGSMRAYVEQHGVAHMVAMGRLDDAMGRMLDLPFMAAFVEAWETAVQPLAAWRVVGLDRADARYLEVAHTLPTPEHGTEAVADAAHAVASFLEDAGVYAAAAVLAEWVLAVRARMFGEEHEDTLSALSTVATLCRLRGMYGRAEALRLRELRFAEARHGPTHPDTLISLNNLALLYRSQERFDLARTHYQRVLDGCDAAFGAEHHHTQTFMTNYASMLAAQGLYEEAEAILVRALDVRSRVLGEMHPGTLQTLAHLASVYPGMGDDARAERLYADVISKRTRVLGEGHPDTLSTMSNLGRLYAKIQRHSEAIRVFQETLPRLTALLGGHHPSVLSCMMSIAGVHEDQGSLEEACDWYGQVVVAGGANQEAKGIIAKATYWLAVCRLNQNRFDQAFELLQGLLDETKANPDARAPTPARLNWFLAECLRGMGRPTEAAAHRRACLDLELAGGDAWDASTLRTAVALCEDLADADEAEAAYEAAARVLAVTEVLVRDDEAHAVWRMRYDVSVLVIDLGHPVEALHHLEAVLAHEQGPHGAEAAEVSVTHWHIARCLRALDRASDAAYHRRRCLELEVARDGGDATGTLQTAVALVDDLQAAGAGDAAHDVATCALAALAPGHADPDADGLDEEEAQEREDAILVLRAVEAEGRA